MLFLTAYAVYLHNGGRKEDFLDLNYADMTLIMLAENATHERDQNDLGRLLGAMTGAKQE